MASSNNLYYFILYSLYCIYVNRKSNDIVLSFMYIVYLDFKSKGSLNCLYKL